MSEHSGAPASGNAGKPESSAGRDAAIGRIPFDNCPLCGERNHETIKTADCSAHPLWSSQLPREMTWLKCLACSHVFVDGYFSPAAERLIFSKINPSQSLGYDLERQRAIAARMIARVNVYGVPGTNWLDVGFGNGALMFTANEFGYDVEGLDLRETIATQMQGLGYKALCGDICDLYRTSRHHFDVISMADVLEHMPFPEAGLLAAKHLLNERGVLLISMPAYESPLWQYLDGQKVNPYWGELEHYHNFSRWRLYELLRSCGFGDFSYGISDRYRACMEIIARRIS